MRGDLELASQERLGRRGAEADDGARLDELDLDIQPGAAGRNLGRVGLLMNPALAARLPLEVLHDVGDVDRSAIDARSFERAIEQLACGADEWTPGEIFGVARLLAHQHQLGLTRAFAEDGLRAVLPQVASLTRLRYDSDVREALPIPFQLIV